MTDQGTPAGWYQDPSQVGELRYHDGTQWTEHVTIDGVQTTAPYESAASPTDATAPTFTMSRLAQWRTEDERPLAVVGRNGVMGQYVTQLDGTPGYRFDDVDGDTVVSLVKPSLKNAIEVRDPAGYAIGTIAKVGRLRSRYDVRLAEDGREATTKLAAGATDAWELQIAGGHAADIARTVTSPPDPLNFAAVTYAVTITATLDDNMERIVLALPLAIDILDTQALV